MTGRIVVGIDGSEQSGYALDWAVARARLGGEQLELVNSYTLVPTVNFFGFHGLPASQSTVALIEFSEHVLDAAAAHVRELAPDLTCTQTSTMGHPAGALAAASEGADAVVVGRRGLGSTASALLGSVSNRLTIEARCPLVVVGEGEHPSTGPIVVGVDESEFGTNALRYAITEAAVRKTSVRAVAALDSLLPRSFPQLDPELLARMRAGAKAEAAEAITRTLDEVQGKDAASVSVSPVVVEGRAAEAILKHAGDAQLIVVGTHGKGLVHRVLLGSVSREILKDADRPVAIVDLPDADTPPVTAEHL
ncbi:universal stress protein [Actinoplanes hulinensis]|uniref:Universal stress protein n=1 Tax=Actinoplanes hulinensis TaxID=1144547 RepID=A0ABS7BDB6_9ACTN|nr:universal stress protein [Actinoplanes hulinensis]MBW6438233.1 universal stress protein [Actinoplanes hulinensis]